MEAIIETRYALDTFYFLVCAALVMWMAAGFTMLEAGLVRAKNTVEILTKNVALYSVACLMYMIIGYNLMYPADGINSIWPGIDWLLSAADNSVESVLASDGEIYYSSLSDFMFQVVFVATAMSIVSGAVAERMKLWSFLAFAVVLTGVIYPIQGYWSWGGGFLDGLGYSDYAGSGIVHMAGAAAALAGVILLGPRAGRFGPDGRARAIPGANLPLATLGTFILWMGWFGFNGGSELAVSSVESANNVARVFVNTNAAAAAGLVTALLVARAAFGKADLTMALNGALAGLVSITAEPLAPAPVQAALIGAVGGGIVVGSILLLDKLRLDDPVGAISVHGTCGIWGVLIVLWTNDGATLGGQLAGLAAIGGFVFIASLVFWAILKAVTGLRVHPEDEAAGLDRVDCGMEAYPEFVPTGSSD
ncbi:MAG: ammonium transporter [Gammaproteobacteria bacterium]|jgi:Amt family ammonium transporter|nr:ammonium transporter [Gammaproteobacteria bacterium]